MLLLILMIFIIQVFHPIEAIEMIVRHHLNAPCVHACTCCTVDFILLRMLSVQEQSSVHVRMWLKKIKLICIWSSYRTWSSYKTGEFFSVICICSGCRYKSLRTHPGNNTQFKTSFGTLGWDCPQYANQVWEVLSWVTSWNCDSLDNNTWTFLC